MSIYRKVLNALVGLERFFAIGILIVAVIGCISVGNFFGALVSAILAVGLNAFYMLMMKRKLESVDGGSGSGDDSASTANRKTDGTVKGEPDNFENLSPARA